MVTRRVLLAALGASVATRAYSSQPAMSPVGDLNEELVSGVLQAGGWTETADDNGGGERLPQAFAASLVLVPAGPAGSPSQETPDPPRNTGAHALCGGMGGPLGQRGAYRSRRIDLEGAERYHSRQASGELCAWRNRPSATRCRACHAVSSKPSSSGSPLRSKTFSGSARCRGLSVTTRSGRVVELALPLLAKLS